MKNQSEWNWEKAKAERRLWLRVAKQLKNMAHNHRFAYRGICSILFKIKMDEEIYWMMISRINDLLQKFRASGRSHVGGIFLFPLTKKGIYQRAALARRFAKKLS